MPRTSSKKAPTNSTASGNSSTVDLFRAASGKAASKELERIDQLFDKYANSTNLIGPEGIESLCLDLEVDHTDVRILMLAWKMQAEKQGYFTLDEWRTGLKALRADSIVKLKKALIDIDKEVRRSNFTDFYSYAFRYSLAGSFSNLFLELTFRGVGSVCELFAFYIPLEEKQKSIDIESICILLDLVLGSQYRPQVDSLCQYLKVQTDYKVINMDQWMGFYRFFNEVGFPNFENYDPDHAWPVILDNFVDWFRSK